MLWDIVWWPELAGYKLCDICETWVIWALLRLCGVLSTLCLSLTRQADGWSRSSFCCLWETMFSDAWLRCCYRVCRVTCHCHVWWCRRGLVDRLPVLDCYKLLIVRRRHRYDDDDDDDSGICGIDMKSVVNKTFIFNALHCVLVCQTGNNVIYRLIQHI